MVVTNVSDDLGVAVGGQAQKRGLIPRLPAPDRLVADAAIWLNGEYADIVRSTHQRTLASGATELAVDLHPAVPPLVLTAFDEGRVTAIGETGVAGPGYHRFAGRVLERLGTELGIDWTEGDGATTFADRPAVERLYLSWLGPRLARARVSVRRGQRGVPLGMPVGTHVTTEDAIATVLGPRDEAWLESAIADPRVALDITPWWADATDARYLLNRALTLMWIEVRWRAPAMEGEADLFDEVHRLLSRAYPTDPDLPYPWHAWAELASLRGLADPMARQAAARAAREAVPDPPVGYRRDAVRISHEGWSLEIPGSYAERRTADEWWGGGAGRSITLAATTTGTTAGEPMSAQAFIDQFAIDLGPDAIAHREGEVLGRARLMTEASSGVEVGILEGFSAVTGSGAAIRIQFDDPGDWQWALDTWRSLAPG
ncbi:MAG TPA: hypothetical protein VFJ80_02225 [Candidatus Limnocylindrales bacterium]|jgi:hypothetical protein|nr:hypothetical protein [Candidatus Limnocylindrales bacterium]